MTAPGQEPDEVITAKPRGKQEAVDERPAPDAEAAEDIGIESQTEGSSGAERTGRATASYDPKKVGDNHMPEDLREDEEARRRRLDEGG